MYIPLVNIVSLVYYIYLYTYLEILSDMCLDFHLEDKTGIECLNTGIYKNVYISVCVYRVNHQYTANSTFQMPVSGKPGWLSLLLYILLGHHQEWM